MYENIPSTSKKLIDFVYCKKKKNVWHLHNLIK